MKINLRAVTALFFLMLGALFVVSAWVGDDTYITMRVVDNFVHGYGLRWNVDERVQVFTHPFWMLLLLAGYLVMRRAFITIIIVSICTALLSIAVFLLKVPRTVPAAIAAAVLLGLSKSFVDYSVSGLENPLTHLLLLVFLLLIFKRVDFSNRDIFLLSLCAGLAAFNRMDTLLLFLPAHFSRRIPEGYIKTLETGRNQFTDANLALYYDKLRLVISGDLWTLERWQAIWGLNMRRYDYLLENYVSLSN